MSLHDRIMGLSIWTESEDFNKGYIDGVYDSGQMAKEADELMAEMAQTLEELRDYDRNNKSEALSAYKSILETLGNYHHFKESTK